MKEPSTDHLKIENTFSLKEEKMFEMVFKAYFPRLKAFCLKFTTDQEVAEDLIQEVFIKIWENRDRIKTETFHSYVFTMVRNACLNYIKHKKIVNQAFIENNLLVEEEGLYYADFFSDPHHQTIYNELKLEIDKVMASFPEQTKIVFELSRFKGLKNQEIAEKLKITPRTVEKHITRALNKFKGHFPENYLFVFALIELFRNF